MVESLVSSSREYCKKGNLLAELLLRLLPFFDTVIRVADDLEVRHAGVGVEVCRGGCCTGWRTVNVGSSFV
jgi:hypothetical protein